MLLYNALSVGSTASWLLQHTVVSEVHSVFRRTFNVITTNDVLIGIGRRDVPSGPFTIATDMPRDECVSLLGLEKGMRVSVSEGSLIADGILTVSLRSARVWQPQRRVDDPLPAERIEKNVDLAKGFALSQANPRGLAQLLPHLREIALGATVDTSALNQFSRYVLRHVVSLSKAIALADLNQVSESAKCIVGVGPGLTPSADDMLVGFMSGLRWAIGSQSGNVGFVKEVNRSITAHSGKTTLLSRQALRHSAMGEVNETVEDLLRAILSGTVYEIEESVRRVLAMGETSGSDLVVGLLLGVSTALSIERSADHGPRSV